MPYTREEAERDRAETLKLAEEAEQSGDKEVAAILRAEAEGMLDRVGMTKCHKPNLGPYSQTNPARCEDCGKPRNQWESINEECIPTTS